MINRRSSHKTQTSAFASPTRDWILVPYPNGYAYSRANYKLSWRTAPALWRVTLEEFRILFREAPAYWREQALPSYLTAIEQWKAVDPAGAPDERLLAGVRALALEDARYWFACALLIGAAKITDALLGRFLPVAAPGHSLTSDMFLRGFPSPTVEAEAELEGLAERIRASDELRALVAATAAAGLLESLRSTAMGQTWLAAFAQYLDRYGHQIYNLDFVVLPCSHPFDQVQGSKSITQGRMIPSWHLLGAVSSASLGRLPNKPSKLAHRALPLWELAGQSSPRTEVPY